MISWTGWLLPGILLTAPAAAPAALGPERWTPAPVASDQYESSPAFTPDGREMYFMRSDRSFGGYRILVSRCEDGAWTQPAPPPFAAKPPALDADPFVSDDGRKIFFVSSRQNTDDGDQLDIWMVRRGADGVFGEPERLPEPINSPASELLPRYTAQGRLYFGSDRPGGHGQGDIYFATEREGGGWDLENMGPPISTAANEYEADISRDGKTLVVVADRGGRSHLYRYRREGEAFISERWIEEGQIPADDAVFQVGPLLSPQGDRLLFAQRDGEARSGEIFLLDLAAKPDPSWPPRCGN